MDGLSPSEISDYREAFSMFDTNGDGRIIADELFQVMQQLGQKVTMEQCIDMINEVDTDGNSAIDFDEFLVMMKNQTQDAISRDQEIRDAFSVFDKNGDGFISLDELGQVMKALGENLSDSELEEMMREVDTDLDGQVSYEEFFHMITTSVAN